MNRAARRRLLRNETTGGFRLLEGGPEQQARHKFNAEIPVPPVGKHQWIHMALYRTSDPTAEHFNLDLENLLTIEGPGCFLCEEPYTPELAARPCPGDVSA